jgi:alpha-galactosidase
MRSLAWVCVIGLVGLVIGARTAAQAADTTTAANLASRAVDIPTDVPDDSVMAGRNETEQMSDWAGAVFLGTQQVQRFLGTDVPFSFRYGGVDSRQAMKTWTRTADVKHEEKCDRHTVSWTDRATGLKVQAKITVWKRYPAVDWVLYFTNTGKKDTPILEDIRALDVILQTDDAGKPAVLHQLVGDYCFQKSFLPFDTELAPGKEISLAPEGGRPSNRTFPFFNLECAGQGMITAIGWSGQWAASLDRAKDGPTRLRAGMEKTHLVLHPGERIRTPRILLMSWQGDRLTAQQRFRRLLMFQYVPKQNGRPWQQPLAGEWFDRYRMRPGFATEAGQLDAAKASHAFGCDTFWIDALWFQGDFPNGVGNWYPKPKDFPRGLKPIGDACHRMGMKFMVWFEPERVAAGSQIAREHPEFVIGGQGGGLFKLNDPKARRWLTELLSRRITEYGIDIYRNDFNINPLDFWRRSDTPDRQGVTEIRYVEGHYAMWDELMARHPGLMIDNCASGGRRFDLETCMRSMSLSRSDTVCEPGHAEWDQSQTLGLSLYIPLHGTFPWSPDSYVMRSGTTAGTCCQFGFLDKDFSMAQAKAALAEARENQKYWYGDFYPLTPATIAADVWAAYQLHRPDLNAGLVLAFRRSGCPRSTLSVKLGGIDPTANYAVEWIDEARQSRRETLSGRQLSDPQELRMEKRASSLLVRYCKIP